MTRSKWFQRPDEPIDVVWQVISVDQVRVRAGLARSGSTNQRPYHRPSSDERPDGSADDPA